MTTWKDHMYGLEPFEESQGFSYHSSNTPPDDNFLVMHSNDVSPTKSSRSKRRSLFRKSSKRASTVPKPTVANSIHSSDHQSLSEKARDKEAAESIFNNANSSTDTFTPVARSIIPEPLTQLPSWYNKDGELTSSSVHQFRARFPIHNPIGPRSYKNHHLLPPSTRPSSVFSPVFPPMNSDGAQEPGWMPAPSRSPSGSPLPTPSSSQTRIQEPGGKRTRKLSNTPHDNVDLLDVSDPWGTNWHHQSPYDVGGLNAERSGTIPEASDGRPGARSRKSSLTGQRHKTTTPSPLSQSTSAIHLQHPDADGLGVSRKLTKRRKPGIRGVFSGSIDTDAPAKAVSAPTTPVDGEIVSQDTLAPLGRKTSKLTSTMSTTSGRASISIASVAPSYLTEKKEKRGSVLGRFARRFSVLRKTPRVHSRQPSAEDGKQIGDRPSLETADHHPTASMEPRVSSSPEKTRQSVDVNKRVPPPSTEREETDEVPEPIHIVRAEPEHDLGDGASYMSVEAPFSMGKLTIANPDTPGSAENSPSPYVTSFHVNSAPPSQVTEHRRRTSEDRSQPLLIPVTVAYSHEMVETPVALSPSTSPPPRAHQPQHTLSHPHGSIPPHLHAAHLAPEQFFPPTPVSKDEPLPISNQFEPPPSQTDDSPLSNLSLLVNPPTPHLPSSNVSHVPSPYVPPSAQVPPSPVQPSPTSPQSPTNGMQSSSRDSSPTKRHASRRQKSSGSVKRETETFRLVRSPSAGNVHPAGETIVAHGEQWAVVGAPEPPKKSKSTKSRRHERERAETEAVAGPSTEQASSSRLESTEHAGSSKTKESTSSRRHRSQSEHKEHHDRSSIDTPAGMPVNGSVNGGARVERRPSTLARPTSELTSAADFNAVRAKDVWEMERLWKGQSMAYGLDGPQLVYAQSIGERSSASVNGDLQRANTMNAAVHGSSHTSYKLQSPFLSPSPTSPQPYSPIPAPPPPIIYQSTTASGSSPSYIYPNGVRSYPDISTIPSMSSPESSPPRRAFTNPLPEPPRESPYRPPPLPASVDDHESASVAEYWNKYAMTTSY